ncbi:yecA family protein [Psychromonas sp. CNPT3]|uniref:UPF0149 family protein n=1 Tax=Psychromonas sp. CNPT3 TaxID=314282 RepID=UPI00006E78B8|nr:UPF0149 family protein [Psychromonas sp. CNPT3]AGH82084.1 yecA family protein [Psychromonas sp. CNPT3]
MCKKSKLSFDDITKILSATELYTTPSEAHGILSGLIAGGVSLEDQSWQTLFNDVVNEGMGLDLPVKKMIGSLYAQVIAQFRDDGLGFSLLLPEEKVPLDERCESMAKWAQGFLLGFGLVQQGLNLASEEIQDIIRDIRDISQLSLDFEKEDEASEIAFAEIVEYLRMGAMLCFNTFSRAPHIPLSKTLH